jgi:hypothetical protein
VNFWSSLFHSQAEDSDREFTQFQQLAHQLYRLHKTLGDISTIDPVYPLVDIQLTSVLFMLNKLEEAIRRQRQSPKDFSDIASLSGKGSSCPQVVRDRSMGGK